MRGSTQWKAVAEKTASNACLGKSHILEPADMKANVATSTDSPLRLLDHPRARIDRVNVQLVGGK